MTEATKKRVRRNLGPRPIFVAYSLQEDEEGNIIGIEVKSVTRKAEEVLEVALGNVEGVQVARAMMS